MRKTRLLILFFLSLLGYTSIYGQTPIKGIINTYHKVTTIDKAASAVIVDDATTLNPGDKVMLVQMKGATVSTNTSTFGNVTDLNEAGNYELGVVCYVQGNKVFLLNTILQDYDPAGKVQLVYIPVYENAIVIDSLKAKPWSNTEGKGGVLALSVTYSLFLSAPLSATGAGFIGGLPKLSSGDCNDYLYPSGPAYNANNTSPQSGAFKGESIWDPTSTSFTGGKAAVANGGGGGNNHNNGGGGGANLSAGGFGGGNNSATTCTKSNPGAGGNALSNNGRLKIYLGGGGGAGHVNTGGILEGGGNGGGIVYLQANSLISSGYTISANGLKGGNSIGDGASGGGAGGSILMNIVQYTDPVSIEALGGNGGQVDDEWINYKCYGEGGGGSGGVIYVKNAPTSGSVSVNGGAKGLKINSMTNCAPPVTGSAGSAGVVGTSFAPIQSTVIGNSCTFVLPTTLLYFKASVMNSDVVARWQVVQPELVSNFVLERKKEGEAWRQIANIKASSIKDVYTIPDRGLAEGSYSYRLNLVEKSGKVVYSSVQRIVVAAVETRALNVFPNPTKTTLHILAPMDASNELRIYDLSGRLLLQKHIVGAGLVHAQDVSTLKAGVYILRIGVQQKMFRIQ